jgi:cobalamin biosynthesis Mg chelatase CobN
MAARTPKAPNTKTGNQPSTTKRSAPNRAQLKAMEARAASAARAAAFARGEDVNNESRAGGAASATRTNRSTRKVGVRAGAQREVGYAPASTELSVRAEMEYHRRDLIRLLLIAAIVVVLYVVLWFFLK